MTDRVITVTVSDANEGSPVVLVLGNPVGRVYESILIEGESTFVVPDTVLKSSYDEVPANITVTSGGYTDSYNFVIEPEVVEVNTLSLNVEWTVTGAIISNVVQNFASTTQTSTRVRWDVDPASGAQLRWRVKGSSDAYTYGVDETTAYASHNYGISGLSPGVTYEVIIESGGSTAALDITTSEAPVVVPSAEGWPSDVEGYDESLPMAGMYSGFPQSGGYGAANSAIGILIGILFRAPRSGYIDNMTVPVRHLRSSDIIAYRDRNHNGNGHIYAAIIDEGMNDDVVQRNKGAYALSSSTYSSGAYLVGNGGSHTAKILDVDDNGEPILNGTVYSQSAHAAFTPTDYVSGEWAEIPMTGTKKVTAGNWYFALLKNETPPPGKVLGGLTVQQAKAMPDNAGATGINGLIYDDYTSSADKDRHGPWFTSTITKTSNNDGASWDHYSSSGRGNWRLRFSTGEYIGQTAFAADARAFSSGDTGDNSVRYGRNVVEGQKRVRQYFAQHWTGDADGIWLCPGLMANDSNGGALTIQLKNNSGNLLATTTMSRESALYSLVNQTFSAKTYNAKGWRYVSLPSTRLVAGNTYYIELSAPSGAGWVITGYQTDYGYGVGKTPSELEYNAGGYAQRSTNGGSSWIPFGQGGVYASTRQISHLICRAGFPRDLPEI